MKMRKSIDLFSYLYYRGLAARSAGFRVVLAHIWL